MKTYINCIIFIIILVFIDARIFSHHFLPLVIFCLNQSLPDAKTTSLAKFSSDDRIDSNFAFYLRVSFLVCLYSSITISFSWGYSNIPYEVFMKLYVKSMFVVCFDK